VFLSRALIIRMLSIAIIIFIGFSTWKRIDAIIDNYQKYYDVALLQKISDEEEKKFNNFSFSKKAKNFNDETEAEIDKKWKEYQAKSPFKTENKPVPQKADEYTTAYYKGFWNFFIGMGFAHILLAIAIISASFYAIKKAWTRITEEAINKFISKF